ncbi:formimidoylglutamase [Mesonia sp. MT50]|uniref:Formimidoylglutamase n=1 Tax=Mesonia profundi TaxID=3070998 RepID=A0ABU1A3U2_9FLAO|nr:formimidoylglutamase [Mesonia profundi]MDQ7918375.1 formimidoylglutamase [Mesonia profundi]
MNIDFFKPLALEGFLESLEKSPSLLGNQIRVYIEGEGFPNLEQVQIAIFGVVENRKDPKAPHAYFDFTAIRKEFYQLHAGNWGIQIADLGDIMLGDSVEDTYFAVKSVVFELLKQNVIPVILGGSQDLAYAQYRAYDDYGSMVNYVNVDSRFDLGNTEEAITPTSFVGKMVVNEPYNLFNYSNLGYQTYFNSQDEIGLLEKLYFDAYRLGEVAQDVSIVEPVFRNANMATIDITSVEAGVLGGEDLLPNGFNGREICAIARYAGISDELSSFGLYHLDHLENPKNSAKLVSQILWYFLEGVTYRKNENSLASKENFLKYQVPVDNDVLIFYKSNFSGRWWIEIPYSSKFNNKLEEHTLLPCTYQDYEEACNQNIPERWWKARRKNEL